MVIGKVMEEMAGRMREGSGKRIHGKEDNRMRDQRKGRSSGE